ncbi:ankyrin repeat domain-containing protein [Siccirubricoccus phaeus]|uniref:ankyrin repeat domain-containing protein n=1 Tax=Siccirubricoccus phaeus TaxID=2595053 RepID=UPI0011F22FFA|nr:ankyrin repeat domain-containing protein [Siccirubricoccus phaeus]
MRRAPLAALLPMAVLAWLALPSSEAAAQFGGNRARNRPTAAAPPERPPPPALPGLQYRNAPEAIPADPNAGDLSPNAALFDAINRGDMAAARDAVARGADIESRNVLGLTPIDSAVDQGRTEIMFYLLSIRTGLRGAPAPAEGPPTRATAAPPPARMPARREAAAPATDRPPAPVPEARNPRLWAGDGGAPIPAIGFLGFDAGRPAVAPPAAASAPAGRRSGRG